MFEEYTHYLITYIDGSTTLLEISEDLDQWLEKKSMASVRPITKEQFNELFDKLKI